MALPTLRCRPGVYRRLIAFAPLALALLLPLAASGEGDGPSAPRPYAVTRVVIDAGHGGHDHGCSGKHSREKHVALDIALKVGGYIQEQLPDVEVIYTRTTDVFVELHERAAIANRAHADVFISIHCNANTSTRPYGTETYVMGLHRNEANLDVAKRENAVITLEDDYNQHYDGFDPHDPTAHIIFSLFQGAHLEQSIELAGRIEEQFAERVGRKSRGVKQAGFLVLYKTTMPAVLIETGFLTNPGEENFLASEEGKVYMASAIFRAFRDYKLHTEAKGLVAPSGETPLASAGTPTPTPAPAPAPVPVAQTAAETAPETVAETPPSPADTRPDEPAEATAQTTAATDAPAEPAEPVAEPDPVAEPEPADPLPAVTEPVADAAAELPPSGEARPAPPEEAPAAFAEQAETAPVETVPPAATPSPGEPETVYRIQVYASHRKYKSTDPLFQPLQGEDLYRAQEGNLYKYMVGRFATRPEAEAKQAELRERGYHDCFIVTQRFAVLAAQ
jgi:N-acetylmuramoyl-L-alanine amidase